MAVRTTLARSIALALAAVSGSAWAGQFDYSLYTTIEHSDNTALTTTDPISTNVLEPGVNFAYTQQGSTLQANVTGNIEYRDYSGSTFDNQTLAEIAGQMNWTVIPKRLDFTVQDYAGVEPVNSLAANAPNNQQQTNVIALGPTLHFRVGDGMTGEVDLHYINSYASKVTEFNSSRGDAAFRIFRDLSPTDQLSGNIDVEHVDFNNTSVAGSNYTSYQAYARYTSRLEQIDIDTALGWSDIDFTQGASQSSPLARVTIGWRLSPRNTLTLNGDYQYADATQDMLQPTNVNVGGELVPLQPLTEAIDTTRGGISVGNVIISSDIYKERQMELTYSYRDERFSFSLAPSYSKLDYVNQTTFNQTDKGVGTTVDYKLTPTMTVSAFATGGRLDYETINRHDKAYRYGTAFSQQLTSHWSWSASFVRQIQASDAVGQSYHENEVFLTLVYKR
ncbi:outer membrane beta-barrel protein [Dyella sp. RRB7]|uniref:outer membrane beta-barrel protein n=1 Tax=Dyella sp. RRB7 TaxID=2919502 RepID=UPI001FAA9215|nr:outer membrane beta-barrel protein [Dyella sp. RRB7]